MSAYQNSWIGSKHMKVSDLIGRSLGLVCARVLIHFHLPGQIDFLQGVAACVTGPVIPSQGLSSPYQRFRRNVKTLFGNYTPVVFPITELELNNLLPSRNLREMKRTRSFYLISEAMFVRSTSI